MPQSTPLENIESNEIPDNQGSDEERVQRIISEMNGGEEQGNPGAAEPPMQYQMPAPPQERVMRGQQMMHPSMVYSQQPPVEQEKPVVATAGSKKNVWAHISDALKLPLVVSVVFFLLSLPLVDVYLARYAHWAFSNGGHLSMAGLALKAVSAGAIMGVYDTIDKLVSRFF